MPRGSKIMKTLMAKGEISCSELEGHFTLSQPTISHHLKYYMIADLSMQKEWTTFSSFGK
ncbi:MAG: helix-turn-helix transcriptional regulator [Flammeovirgaceae bacterium]|nr:helix-turn-helix transcriptional regulator [Flammeovirgaceae bacterium]